MTCIYLANEWLLCGTCLELTSDKVVDRASAILGLPNEDIIPLNESHRDLCRFDSQNASYISVSSAIKRIACHSNKLAQVLKHSSTHSSNRCEYSNSYNISTHNILTITSS